MYYLSLLGLDTSEIIGTRLCGRQGAHFINDFFIVIQIWLKFHSTLLQVVVNWSLWNFAYGMTALLSWLVQNFVAIWCHMMELHLNKFSSNLNYDGKIVREMGPSTHSSNIITIMAADGLVTQWAKAPAGMILTSFSHNIPVSLLPSSL